MKCVTLIYLATYLGVGGLGLLLAPRVALLLLLSTGDYGDVMPRVVGMFMLVLSALVATFIRRRDYSYYLTTIVARVFIVATLAVLYFRSADPLFLVLEGIVLVGLAPAIYVHFVRRAESSTPVGPREQPNLKTEWTSRFSHLRR